MQQLVTVPLAHDGAQGVFVQTATSTALCVEMAMSTALCVERRQRFNPSVALERVSPAYHGTLGYAIESKVKAFVGTVVRVHPVSAAYPKAASSQALPSEEDLRDSEMSRCVYGVLLSVLTPGPARANRGRLECSDLSPLTKGDASTKGHPVQNELRSFRAVMVVEGKDVMWHEPLLMLISLIM